mmetsp:Transcript_36781/g.54040  ORF Transcript_36781/g.54040 Transcript_36781/m.54040 type:complete len:106 (-) Transcript_36781:48-365(-)
MTIATTLSPSRKLHGRLTQLGRPTNMTVVRRSSRILDGGGKDLQRKAKGNVPRRGRSKYELVGFLLVSMDTQYWHGDPSLDSSALRKNIIYRLRVFYILKIFVMQ